MSLEPGHAKDALRAVGTTDRVSGADRAEAFTAGRKLRMEEWFAD